MERITLSQRQDIRSRQLAETPSYMSRFNTLSRGLHERSYMTLEFPVVLKGYVDKLPLFKGKNVEEIIDLKVERSTSPVRILDVGAGRGQFLIDCKEKWGDKVECVGVSSAPLHDNEVFGPDEVATTTTEVLKSLSIPMAIGDAHQLSLALSRAGEDTGFDLVTSVHTMQHLADGLAALKGMYNVLNPDGIGLVHDGAFINMNGWEDRQMQKYLVNHYGFRYSSVSNDVAFQKSHARLLLPVYALASENSKRVAYGLDHKRLERYTSVLSGQKVTVL